MSHTFNLHLFPHAFTLITNFVPLAHTTVALLLLLHVNCSLSTVACVVCFWCVYSSRRDVFRSTLEREMCARLFSVAYSPYITVCDAGSDAGRITPTPMPTTNICYLLLWLTAIAPAVIPSRASVKVNTDTVELIRSLSGACWGQYTAALAVIVVAAGMWWEFLFSLVSLGAHMFNLIFAITVLACCGIFDKVDESCNGREFNSMFFNDAGNINAIETSNRMKLT